MDRKPENSHDENKLEGRYANYFKIGYNAFEFIFDFEQFYSEGKKEGQRYTRIITSPVYAKRLLETLQESIEQYEKSHGEIDVQNSQEQDL